MLLAVPWSSAYTQPQNVSAADIDLMRQLDKLYLKWPFYGSHRLCVGLQQQGYQVNRQRIQRLMRKMGAPGDLPEAGNESNRKRALDLSLLTERPED